MQQNPSNAQLHWRSLLSGLWLFYLLNMLFRDIHEFFRPGFIEQLLTGVVNGTQMSDELLLVAGIVLQIPLVMMFLSRLLPDQLNRWLNIVAALIALLGIVLSNGSADMDDLMFASLQALALLFLIYLAWQGPGSAQST
ncbi:DUF6326 family protein [Agaribacterium haliotis]|uniref:DUF6326 family protein n=1 Tax=Agaribacterium haliotis TaxID=2013869 RepID=UPI000BB596C9|nr:DUF6326 family protein [Agaribacterium haliotis]